MKKTSVVGQTKAAGFQIGVRRTFPAGVEATWRYLCSDAGLSAWLGKIRLEDVELNKPYKTEDGTEGEVRVFKPNSHMRLTWKPRHWTNTSALQIRVIAVKEKTTISFHQDKLLDPQQRNEMKQHWDTVLDKIANEIAHKYQ